MTEYHSIHSLLDLCKEQEKQVWEVVQQADMEESGATEKQVFEKMRFMYKAMQQADKDYEADLKSQSGILARPLWRLLRLPGPCGCQRTAGAGCARGSVGRSHVG